MAQGRKRPDSVYPTLPNNPRPLDYWKWLSAPGVPMVAAAHHWVENGGHNQFHTCWGICAPDGDFRFVQDITVREETDGTISVVQGDGGWDNKLVYGTPGTAQYWEGWLNHGDWVAAQMAITLDKVLGGVAGGTGTSLGFNTTQAIAAGARVSVCVGNWGMGTGAQANSVTASGLTFHLDESEANTTPQARGTMWLSEPDASGHASGLTITAGWASSVDATTICAASFLGLDTGTSGYAAATPPTTVSEAGTTDWATGTVTPPAGDVLLVAMVNMDGVTTDTVTTTAPATEAQTFASATTTEGVSQSYRIVTADGSTAYSIAGTFSSAPGEQTYHLVAYKASAAATSAPGVVRRSPLSL